MSIKSNLAKAATVVMGMSISAMALAVPVYAQTTVQNRVNQAIQDRCERVTQRVDNRISLYDQNKQNHIDRYNKIVDTVTNLGNRLEAKGYDITQVKANLQTLNQMVITFAQDYTAFVNTLRDSKNFACGNSEGQFQSTIQTALSQLKSAREQAQSILTFVQNTLRPSILALKSQTPKPVSAPKA